MDEMRQQLERGFGAACVGAARARFDAPEVPCVTPADEALAVEVVRFAASERLRVMPVGFGSKLGWGAPLERLDLLLSTRALAGVVALEPGDGTVAALAGTTLADLGAATRAAGYWLTPDVARPARATLGGVLAAGASGIDRLRFGPVRHHVLGMRVLLANGTRAKSGGQLVKNVTGYDLHRLYCGSRGTLCVILDAALRLFPEPESERWFALELADSRSMLDAARRALATPLRFVLVAATRAPAGAWILSARLFGKRAPVEAEARELAALWPGARVLVDGAARAAAESWRDSAASAGELPSLAIRCRPSALERALSCTEKALAGARLAPALVLQHGVCTLELVFDGAVGDAPALEGLRAELRAFGARSEWRNAPAETRASTEAPPAAAIERMELLKQRLDPAGLFPRLVAQSSLESSRR